MGMRESVLLTKLKGMPRLLLVSRLLFGLYFLAALVVVRYEVFPGAHEASSWFIYLLCLYGLVEYGRAFFLKRGIDLTFSLPLLFSIFLLNFASVILRAQEQLPVLNRAEHFASFVFITYTIWIFFLHYLPQNVWQEHPYYTALLVLSVASLFGVLNEIVELGLDTFFGTTFVGLRFDTSLDILMNTLGSIMFLSVRLILLSGKILE